MMPASESNNAIYTAEQIDAYLAHISFPVTKYKKITPEQASTEEGLAYLAALQKYQLAAVPFENLTLHYSKERLISLDKEDLFDKIVNSKNGRGGYCMENNMLFRTVLKSLGFEVIPIGARVLIGTGSKGWSHGLNLICIAGETYLVDVGFGGTGPTRPMPLVHGKITKWGATDAETRLVYQEPSNPIMQGLWTLEHRVSEAHDWTQNYCFGMIEFWPGDYEVMNFQTSTRRSVWFTYTVVCLKMILDEKLDDITGAVFLTDATLKRKIFDKTETLAECTTEEQRVSVLKDFFGIGLSKREQAGIKGSSTELKGGK